MVSALPCFDMNRWVGAWFADEVLGCQILVADSGNNRVLYFVSSGSIIPTAVYGQNGNYNTMITGCNATTLNGPTGVVLDSGNNMYGE
jgi:hypothetical protein